MVPNYRTLTVETPFPCQCDVRYPCKCLTFMAALEQANQCEDVSTIEVKTGTHTAFGRQWVNKHLTIRGIVKRGESMPQIDGARLMVCNGSAHKLTLIALVCVAEANDYAVDVSGHGMEVEMEGCDVKGGWHGVSVRAGATATLTGCKVYGNSWNGVSAVGVDTHVNLLEGTVLRQNGRCGLSVSAGVQAVLNACTLEGNAEAGVEAFGSDTRVQIDRSLLKDNDECGIKAARGCMLYLVDNTLEDADGIDPTCLVMKEGVRQVMPRGMPLPQVSVSPVNSPPSSPTKGKGYFEISPSQQILLARAKREEDMKAERAEAKRAAEAKPKKKF